MEQQYSKDVTTLDRVSKQDLSSHYEVSDEQSKLEASETSADDTNPIDKRLLWKLDVLLIPIIAMLYLLVFIDRMCPSLDVRYLAIHRYSYVCRNEHWKRSCCWVASGPWAE
jgi:hypothetical protein